MPALKSLLGLWRADAKPVLGGWIRCEFWQTSYRVAGMMETVLSPLAV
jgi:hypothetical protein